MISVVYWSLLFLKPSLVLRRNTPDGLNLTLSVKPSDDLIRVPLHLDLALHAVPGFVLLLDFFLFEQKYARDQARYKGAFVTAFASIWYGWWVEHCASFNGSCKSRLYLRRASSAESPCILHSPIPIPHRQSLPASCTDLCGWRNICICRFSFLELSSSPMSTTTRNSHRVYESNNLSFSR